MPHHEQPELCVASHSTPQILKHAPTAPSNSTTYKQAVARCRLCRWRLLWRTASLRSRRPLLQTGDSIPKFHECNSVVFRPVYHVLHWVGSFKPSSTCWDQLASNHWEDILGAGTFAGGCSAGEALAGGFSSLVCSRFSTFESP